jgi:hypothetical protein
MKSLADRFQALIDDMKRRDEELQKEIFSHVAECQRIIEELEAIDKQ